MAVSQDATSRVSRGDAAVREKKLRTRHEQRRENFIVLIEYYGRYGGRCGMTYLAENRRVLVQWG